MYVNILSFKISESDGITSNELSMFEGNQKPNGLDRFHIFKDIKEKSNNYPYLNRIHKISNEKKL